MKPQSPFAIFLVTLFVLTTSSVAWAAKSPAMQACSAQWADMKKAARTEGQTILEPMQQGLCGKERRRRSGAGEEHKILKKGSDGGRRRERFHRLRPAKEGV